MTTTMTFRLDADKRKKLRQKSRLLGKSESQFLRELVDRELNEKPLSQALSGLKGVLSLQGKPQDKWRKEIKQRNWRA
jgi:predicted DNA-binding protein